jgi:hypothetical protein
MKNSTNLERRYRRLLALYPEAFRRHSEHEVVSVLMEGSKTGQQWPRPAEATDLVKHAIPMRWRHPNDWARKHARGLIVLRVVIGVWLVCLSIVLSQYSSWGLALFVPAAMHFVLALRVALATGDERETGGPRSVGPPGLGR